MGEVRSMNSGKIESEYKLSSYINNQLKYKDVKTKDISLQKLLQALEVVNIACDKPVMVKNKDEYFDTVDDFLVSVSATIRIREVDKKDYFITLKQKVKNSKTHDSLVRDELEIPVAKNEAQIQLRQLFYNTYKRSGYDLIPKVTILNERHQIPIKTNQAQYLLCFDKYSFYSASTNVQSEDFYEIEIESSQIMENEDIQLQQYLKILNLFNYALESESKFKKALKWLNNPVAFENKQFVTFDIVQYSLKTPLNQKRAICNFFYIIEENLKKHDLFEKSLKIPTGDGLILSFDEKCNILPFLSDVYNMVLGKNKQSAEEQKLCFRTAIHCGAIFEYQDINGNVNYAGDGINMVSRIIGQSDDWQVLVSDEWYSLVRLMGYAIDLFSDSWNVEVKHGVLLTVRNYYNRSSKVGIPQ